MVSKRVTVIDRTGLHMKPAAQFACTVQIKNETGIYNAKSVISVLGACVRNGDEIEVICDGEDEREAVDSLVYDISHKLYHEETEQGE